MPRKTIDDYIFYKIVDVNANLDLCYVGSSVNMKRRKEKHKSACKCPNDPHHNLKVYKTIRENGGWDEFRVVEIGFREQITLRQSHFIEDEYRVLLKAQLNSQRCHTTPEQRKEDKKNYYKENKEEICEYSRKYNEEHKEIRNEKHICPCGGKFTYINKTQHEKTQKHKTYIAEQKAFYEKLETEQNDANYMGYDEVV